MVDGKVGERGGVLEEKGESKTQKQCTNTCDEQQDLEIWVPVQLFNTKSVGKQECFEVALVKELGDAVWRSNGGKTIPGRWTSVDESSWEEKG